MAYKAKRLGGSKYLYRGYIIQGHPYYPPEQSAVWEAYDESGCAFAQSYTFKDTKDLIDDEILNIKTNESKTTT